MDGDDKRLIVAYGTGGTLLVLSLVFFFRWACHSEFRQTRVSELTWVHRTNLRQRGTFRDGDWGSPPARGGFYSEPTWDYDCQSKYHHSSCTTVGKSTMCTPIYRRWCRYSYYDWPIITFQERQGSGHEMSWLTYGDRLDETHRETREGWYKVSFTDTRQTWTWTTRSVDQYERFVMNDYWQLEFPNWGDMHPVKRLPVEGR